MPNTIYEYSEVTHEKLKSYIINTPQLHKYFKLDWNILKSQQYCGILNFEGEDFYLLPKISQKDDEKTNLDTFIYMLMYAYNIKLQNEQIASCQNESYNILEVFIQMFAKKLFQELQFGVFKEYITEQENITTLRGKYLINENLKYNMTKNKIYCEYDEFSMDNTLNQFFLFAVKSLLVFAKDKRVLMQCEIALDEVEVKSFDINILNIHFHRLNNRFKESFEFAILLLQKSIPLFSKDKKSFAFLFDMNELFEKFIGRIFSEIDPSTKLQNQKNFGNLQLKPDIITTNMIIDTKYKILKSRDDLAVSDKYQMFVYGTNFGIKNTMLLYPKHLEHFDYEMVLGKDEREIGLKIRSIDLACAVSDSEEVPLEYGSCGYGEFVEEIKNRLENI
ncbi:MAG: restriction endonuclease [Sulfurimonas sp.]|jgi:5-methylcytosine-specific restriction enzyme subunit McrC